MAVQGEILVNTTLLEQKASAAEMKIRELKNAITVMEEKSANMRRYWQGEGSDRFLSEFDQKKEVLQEVVRRFQEEVADLRKMAGIYQEAELAAKDIAQQLPVDVII